MTWLEETRLIVGKQLAEWSEAVGKKWYDQDLTPLLKKDLIRYLSENYPYECRSGFAYKTWRKVIRELKIDLGLIKKDSTTPTQTPSQNPNQLSLF